MKLLLEVILNPDRLSGHAEARRLVQATVIRACNEAIDKINKEQSKLGLGPILEKVKLVEFPISFKGIVNIGAGDEKNRLPSGAFS